MGIGLGVVPGDRGGARGSELVFCTGSRVTPVAASWVHHQAGLGSSHRKDPDQSNKKATVTIQMDGSDST